MDIVASKDQDALKDILKSFNDKDTEATLNCKVRKSDDSEFDVVLSFSGATYDGEACIQLIARPQVDSELEEKLKRFSSEDLLTGLFNKQHFTEQLDDLREKALDNKAKGPFSTSKSTIFQRSVSNMPSPVATSCWLKRPLCCVRYASTMNCLPDSQTILLRCCLLR